MDQTAMSSTLLYPSFMYSSTRPTSHNFPSTKDKSTSLTITSMSTGINNITVILNVQEQSSLVSLGTSPIMFGSVDTITASLESLHQSLNINQRSNLNGTYLYATTPALVTLGTLGSRTDQMDIDSTLDIILPLASIGEDYFLFPTDIDPASTETIIQCQAVFDWTYVIIPIVEPISFLLPSTGDIHQQSLNNRHFYRIYGNASFYVYQISTRLSGGHLDTCMTSLLPSSLWRDEYDIAKVPDAYAVNIYIIAEATLPLDLVTNDTSLEWTCQSIPGSNYSGCSTRLPSEVTYLHLQLKDKKVMFGAYLLGQGDTSVFCHSVGVSDIAISSNDLNFPHEIYLQRLRNRHKDSCDNTLTTEQTVTSTEVTNQDTSHHNSSISQDVTTIVPESFTEVTADPTSSSSSSSVTTSPAKNTLATSTPDIHEKTEAIVSFLKEDYQGLSSYKRARISVPDTRISSQVIGATGIAFLTCALVLLSYSDIISLIRFIILLIKKEK
ncbi:uncharacterized protein LOC129922708 [Biomphalaria glabrata]|uniref:Uncharacterized protein LOC129922708 n=1 Tax=Biomphalaria glabrata TaxID=6526 RepID=A0A9W2YS91_BIOGL|nr:uncharacterized protein LOC129922708 [Biomphalaria glabrata]